MDNRMYLHVDLDAFFASVEVLDNPELKGKPLIVGGLPGERRSVVSTCSYEARKYGVHSAMPTSRAYELCPDAIFLHGRMERYHEKSEEVMAVFREFSPDVMQMSIDEAFIDITGTELLFGDPVTLATSLKKKVLEKTGLTVSVGIASNRYVAKIASGLKKPDGLCYVPKGEEEKFMLSLPLDKLWGIGTKSRERLNACGIFTIPEIHAISETALKELFGEASGSFLYRSVRGMDVEHFGDETKSRSMSAERTFCFDLSDIYGIETELLHLSYDVMFRVLKAKVNSKTVCLKIRYEDFTTVSVTESSTRIVSSIEDLFERACRLFHKKYERGRGIRLLGLGLQNVTDGLESQQGELFDFGEKRQRAVETTVLRLHQKAPETRLKKARQLITSLFAGLFLTGALLFTPQPVYAEDVEFEVQGSWEALLSGSATAYFGMGAPTLSLKPPVFTQKADALVWFMYDNHWYFDATVSTDSDSSGLAADFNRIAAGYEGDGLVREARIGTDIGTDKMSPGFRLKLEGSMWDAALRVHLDAIQTHTKTFRGSSELVSSSIPLTDFRKGFLYALPDSLSTQTVTGIFVEDASGTYQDSFARRYRRLSQDEYLVLPGKCLIYLEKEAKGAVIAETADRTALESSLSQFLKDVSLWFDDRGAESTYSMMGITCTDESAGPAVSEMAPLFTAISSGSGTGTQGLYLSRPGYFSPFQVASLYKAQGSEEALVSVDASSLYAEYTTPILMESSSLLIQVLEKDSSDSDFTKARVRYPAVRVAPWIYMPSEGITEENVPYITATSSERADSFSIGPGAIEGSIQVLKNGVPVPADYDRSTGKVTLLTGWSANDTITILWNEYSSQSQDMTLTLAADFTIAPTPFFTAAAKLSTELFIDPATRKFSATADAEPYATATIDTRWERSFANLSLSFANTASARATLIPATQELPLFSLSGAGREAIWFLDSAAASTTTPVLTARPSAPAATLPVLAEAKQAGGFSVQSIRKQGVSGSTISIEGTLPENTGSDPYWFAADIPLSQGASSLPSAHEFSFVIKDLSKTANEYEVFLTLGTSSSSDAVSSWLISQGAWQCGTDVLMPFALTEDGTQTVKVMLTDADRQKLEKEQKMRLIFVSKSSSHSQDINVELYGSADAAGGISFNVHAEHASGSSAALPVSVTETASSEMLITWNTSDALSGDSIIVERAIPALAAANWRTANILLYIPDDSSASGVTVNLQTTTPDGYVTASSYDITESELSSRKGSWLRIARPLSTDAAITRIQYVINAVPESGSGIIKLYTRGILLSDPVSTFTVSDEARAAFSWTSGDYSASLSADASGAGTGMPELSDNLRETSLTSSAQASFTSPFLNLSGQGSFDLTSPKLLSGEYTAATGNGFLSGIVSASDTFRFNYETDAAYRKDTLSLSLAPLSVPFLGTAAFERDRTGATTSGKNIFALESSYSAGKTALSLTMNQTKAPSSAWWWMGSSEAEKRTESGTFTQLVNLAGGKFTPSLELGFSAASERIKADRTGIFKQTLTLPFSIGSNRLSFTYSRETSAEYQSQQSDATYVGDLAAYFAAFNTHAAALKQVPVYDLFNAGLAPYLASSLTEANQTSRSTYTSSGTATWSRPLRADWLDLVLPNSASVSATRTVSAAGPNTLDRSTESLNLTFTAFNLFGSSSASGLFSFYEQDEFQYSVKLTKGSGSLKTEITGYGTLYFADSSQFNSFYSGTLTGTEAYTHTFQFSWNRPAVLFDKDATRFTTGTVSLHKEATTALTASANLSHKASVSISDYLSINGTAAVNAEFKAQTALTFTLSIGGKLQF